MSPPRPRPAPPLVTPGRPPRSVGPPQRRGGGASAATIHLPGLSRDSRSSPQQVSCAVLEGSVSTTLIISTMFCISYPTLDCIKPPGPTVPPRAALRTVYQLVVMPLTAIELSCF